jgi:lipoprotein-releasing system permease protein
MPWYFYLALKQLFPTGRFPFFTAISITGVALGVWVLVVVTSVMGGFGYELRRMIVQTEGEVQVKGHGYIEDVQPILATVRATPGVVAATPYVAGVVAVLSRGRSGFPMFRGLELDTVGKVADLDRFMRVGRIEDLDDDSVILSARLAEEIGARLGDTVEIYSLLIVEKLKNDEVFLPRQFKIVGFFEVGHQHIDSSTVYGTLRAAQDIYGLGRGVHGVNVRIEKGQNENAVALRLNTQLRGAAEAMPWTRSWESFLWVLQLEKTINFFLLLFIVIIAAFSVMSSLLISVVRKTREIGLLGALGGSSRDVALCFCGQAFIIGVTGTVVGMALAFGTLAIRNQIVHGIAKALDRMDTLRQFYQFTDLPSQIMPGDGHFFAPGSTAGTDLLMTVVAAIVFSTLAGLIPAWRAARLKPVEALRSE